MIAITLAAFVVANAPVSATAERAAQCRPKERDGVRLVVDQRIERTDVDRFVTMFFSEQFNNEVGPIMGIKSRKLMSETARDDGTRKRVTRMYPTVELPPPLKFLQGDQELRYDEVAFFDPDAKRIRFFVDHAVCDQVKYAGTIAFIPDGDGVRMRIEAALKIDAPFVGGIIEEIVKQQVNDGWKRYRDFAQRYVDRTNRVASR